MAYVEAYIDFNETDNIEDFILSNIKLNLKKLAKEIEVCFENYNKSTIYLQNIMFL